jgi:isopenicillin-N N-acyltransferase like protein
MRDETMGGDGLATIPVIGGPRERGQAAGRALAPQIHRSLDFYRGFLDRRGLRSADLSRVLAPYRSAAEAVLPALVEEIEGLAAGAEASFWELFAANAWEELEPMLATTSTIERCTAFAVAGPDGTVLGHNEQWYAGDAGNTAVIAARPDRGTAFVSPSVVTCLPAVGMNAAGTAQAIMSLSARDDGVGVPRVLVSRHALQADDPDHGRARAAMPGRAGGYAHLFAGSGATVVTVETSATGDAVVEGGAHTNHYLDPELAAGADAPDPGSVARLERLRDLLAERQPSSPTDAMAVLRDHDSSPAICLHPDPADGDEAESVLFSMVCHLEERRMWVADGNPCMASFEEIDLAEAFG